MEKYPIKVSRGDSESIEGVILQQLESEADGEGCLNLPNDTRPTVIPPPNRTTIPAPAPVEEESEK